MEENRRTISIIEILESWWKIKHPVLVFSIYFIVSIIIFYIIIRADYFKSELHPSLINLNAQISGFALNMLGQNTVCTNSIVSSNLFSVDIRRGCDAIEPIILFVSAVTAFPTSISKKLVGVFVGIIVLFSINILRIICLFLTGVYVESLFEIMHVDIWQYLFIFFAILLCLFWIQWSSK